MTATARAVPAAYGKELYRLLEIDPGASAEVVEAAYRTLLRKYAPRALGDSDQIARALGEAYGVLSVTAERRAYDEHRKTASTGGIGPYEVLSFVAEGGFGTTYKARHALVQDLSCLKHCSEISAQAEQILFEETRAIWNLRHYGLPIMRDVCRHADGSLVLAMSWIEGPTLEQIVEKQGKLDAEHVAWIMERILNTLLYLHYHGVLHGDIKPQNIIVQPESHIVVLVDFGLSMVKPTGHAKNKGYTELFSPPEQVRGDRLMPASDFYSLAMSMLYALGGGTGPVERKQIPPGTPNPMREFIKALIKRDMQDRPQDAQVLFDDIENMRMQSFGRTRSNLKTLTA